MTNPSEDIKARFQAYIKAFNTKQGSNLLPFFHDPVLLIDRQKDPVILDKSIIGSIKSYIGFKKVFKDLEEKGFDHSELDNKPEVKLLSEKLGIITGNATRYKTDHSVLERFGYTYTFRESSNLWKIVTGIIHDWLGFNLTEATQAAAVVANAEPYNGFIASDLTWGILSGSEGYPIKIFFLACVIIAGLFGAVALKPTTLLIQTLPGVAALACVWLSRPINYSLLWAPPNL